MKPSVFKFGGASVKDADHIRNVETILSNYPNQKLLIVISAMGKTTNKLEGVFRQVKLGTRFGDLIAEVISEHLSVANQLNIETSILESHYQRLAENASEKIELLKDNWEGVYDQVVSMGELLSTLLVTSYLQSKNISAQWIDVRNIVATDNTYREGKVDFELTQKRVLNHIKPSFKDNNIVITQGFLGGDTEGFTTTLGREGSDYTAAIMAYCLDVGDVTVWKDVPGILTADPRRFDNVEKIDKMSYKEAIEMTYYGAQVIHPKTIRPLQNKSIALHVKSFKNHLAEGTVIAQDGLLNYPPLVVIQDDVILLQISSKDFSFIAENHLSEIFQMMNNHRINLRTMRNSAISFTVGIKNPSPENLAAFLEDLGENFSVEVFKNLQLITVRYFNKHLIETLTRNKVVLFEERMKYTIQMMVRKSLELKEKE